MTSSTSASTPDIDTSLTMLEARLVPMTPLPPSRFTVSSQLIHAFVDRNSAGDEWPGWLLHATARGNKATIGAPRSYGYSSAAT